MVQVLLVRHGAAIDGAAAPSDAERWLLPDGRRRVREVARVLAARGVGATHLYTSPLVRAVQTAEILAAALEPEAVVVHPPLAGGTTAGALAPVERAQDGETVVLVGHEPLLRAMAARLTGFDHFPGLRPGAVCAIGWRDGTGSFRWMIDPRTLAVIDTLDGVD
ncbi:MAG: histidine phosphatase family protein [Myxococcota bacterium]|nr:histidine phosphatase family protein [Myxococcota bacterium]MDW8362465.1 phosphoglycerate mutase family protein [Myxococcales bacterium]